MYRDDPRYIFARYPGQCAETGKTIEKGQECIYYPATKKIFSLDSKQATEFRKWKQDIEWFGANY